MEKETDYAWAKRTYGGLAKNFVKTGLCKDEEETYNFMAKHRKEIEETVELALKSLREY